MTEPKEKIARLLEAAKPLMKYLAENHHPHCKVIVEADSAELVEGLLCAKTNEFIRD